MADSVFEQVLIECLEQFAFLFADPVDSDEMDCTWEDSYWLGKLHFESESHTGTLQMVMPADLCVEMTVNVMGLDGEDEATEALLADALKEFVNIAAGTFTAAAFGTGTVFKLSPPEAEKVESGDAVATVLAHADSVACLQVDDYCVAGCYELE